MHTAIVVGGGGFQGLPVLRSLHALGWRVAVADSIRESLNRFEADEFFQVPETKDFDAFRVAITELVRQCHAEAVFPTTMYDLPALALLRPALEQLGCRVFASSPELVALLADKAKTTIAAAEQGLPVLPSIDPFSHDFSFPLIEKPLNGWGRHGVQRIATFGQLPGKSDHQKISSCIWQRELQNFIEWSADFALRDDGQYSAPVCRKRMRTSGGFAVISEIIQSKQVEQFASKTAHWLSKLGGYGIFNVQFLEEESGAFWLSDINPRPGTSSICTLAIEANLIDFLLNSGIPAKQPTWKHGLVIRTLKETFLPLCENHIKGVVFDLDETLICQKSWMLEKMKILIQKIRKFHLREKDVNKFRNEAMRIIDEGPWHTLIDTALERSNISPQYADELIDMWRQINPGSITCHPDAVNLIHLLQEHKIPTALLTDNPAHSQLQKIHLLPDTLKFGAIIMTDNLATPKPDTKGFFAISEALSIHPDNLLMIGDSPWKDALGALGAGYTGAVIVKRPGAMTNPDQSLFREIHPEFFNKIHWTETLYGLNFL